MDFDNLPVNASTARISLTRTAIPSARRSCSPIAARCWQANSLKSPTSTGGRGWQRGQRVMKSRLESAIESSLLGRWDHVRSVNTDPVYSHVRYKSIYLPIWLCDYEYRGKRYTCTINAQTGKVIGKAARVPLQGGGHRGGRAGGGRPHYLFCKQIAQFLKGIGRGAPGLFLFDSHSPVLPPL